MFHFCYVVVCHCGNWTQYPDGHCAFHEDQWIQLLQTRSYICWEEDWKSITVDFTGDVGSALSCFSLLICTEQLNQSVNLGSSFYGVWGRFSMEMSTQTNTQKNPTVIVTKIYPCFNSPPSGNQGSQRSQWSPLPGYDVKSQLFIWRAFWDRCYDSGSWPVFLEFTFWMTTDLCLKTLLAWANLELEVCSFKIYLLLKI